MGTCLIWESAAKIGGLKVDHKCCANPNAMMTREVGPKLVVQGGPALKFPFSHPGQCFYSRVLENCEDVADFDEVGCP